MLLVVKRKTKTLRKQARSRIICESCTERLSNYQTRDKTLRKRPVN